MKKIVLGLMLASASIWAQERTYKIDGLQSKHDGSRGIVPIGKGEFIISGWTNGAPANYKEDCNGWLFRINDQGQVKWQVNLKNNLGTGRGAQISGHVLDTDGTILLGFEEFRSKGWGKPSGQTGRASLNRYTLDGKLLKQKFIGGAGTDVIDIIRPMADGTYVLAGETTSPIGKSYNGWLLKVDKDFNILWNKTFGGFGYERFNEMIPTQDGGFLAMGRTIGKHGQYKGWAIKVDKDGNQVWEKVINDKIYASTVRSMVATKDGGFVFAGFTHTKESKDTSRSAWIGKISATGKLLWDKELGGDYEDVAYDMTQLNDGNFAAAGRTMVNGKHFDAWVIGFSQDGKVLWKKQHGDAQHSETIRNIIAYKKGYMLSGRTLNLKKNVQDSYILFVDQAK